MKKYYLLSTLLLLLTSNISYAADYYFCDCQSGADANCTAGSDSANGLTPATAKRTFNVASQTFRAAAAGDTINFCRGGAFVEPSARNWNNSNSRANNRIVVQDYTPSPAPVIDARPKITHTGNGHLFELSKSGSHQEGYTFKNLDLKCTGCSGNDASVGFFLYNDIDDVTIDNVRIDSFRIGVQGADTSLSNCVLKNSQIVNSHGQGFLGGCENGIIENNTFTNNGGFTNKDHNLYWSRGDNVIIRGNTLYKSSTGSGDTCSGSSIVIHTHVYPMDNILIEGNNIYEDLNQANGQCYGISVAPGYSNGELFTNVTIRGNIIKNVGARSVNLTSCHDCLVENNIIIQEQNSYKNTAISSGTSRGAGDASNTRHTYRNNSIYNSSNVDDAAAIAIRSGSGNTVVSNAIHYTGNSASWNCFEFGTPITNNTMFDQVDNNICYFPNANNAEFTDTYGKLAGWQSSSIFGTNSQQVTPGFTSPAFPSYDMNLVTTSSAINTGHQALSSQKDLRNKNRDGQPDVGAYEYGSFNPPAATTLRLIPGT